MVEASPRKHRRHALSPEGPDHVSVGEKVQAKCEPGTRLVHRDRSVANSECGGDPAGARKAHREPPTRDRFPDRIISVNKGSKGRQHRPQIESRETMVPN